jgi:uncharacterized protein YjiK
MPGRLDEISGLALTSEGRLFAHNDEHASVYEVDVGTGTVTRGFSLGDPAVRGDFEGIAVVGERIFLVTSRGMLYEFREGPPGSSVAFRETDLGVGDHCEVEGLAHHAADASLLVACKEVTPDDSHVVIHRVPLDPTRGQLAPIRVAKERIRAAGGTRNFSPSAVAIDPETGHLVLLAARQERQCLPSVQEPAPQARRSGNRARGLTAHGRREGRGRREGHRVRAEAGSGPLGGFCRAPHARGPSFELGVVQPQELRRIFRTTL